MTEENIVVSVRLRPLDEQEIASGISLAWETPQPHTLRCLARDRVGDYTFDDVFDVDATSRDVYDSVAAPLIDSAMQGMNVTLFAYGQTGSGKTYTMNALMQSAGEHVFQHIATSTQQYLIKCDNGVFLEDSELFRMSAIEIYNETVKDLLVDDGVGLRIMDDPERGPVVEKLTETVLTSRRHFETTLCEIQKRRQVAATLVNDQSSRSHAIVRLYLESSESEGDSIHQSRYRHIFDFLTGLDEGSMKATELTQEEAIKERAERVETVVSTICFVDLAGAERSSIDTRPDTERLRLKEARS